MTKRQPLFSRQNRRFFKHCNKGEGAASRQLSGTAPRQLSGTAPRQLSGTAPRQLSGAAPRQLSRTASRQLSRTAPRQLSRTASRQLSRAALRRCGVGKNDVPKIAAHFNAGYIASAQLALWVRGNTFAPRVRLVFGKTLRCAAAERAALSSKEAARPRP